MLEYVEGRLRPNKTPGRKEEKLLKEGGVKRQKDNPKLDSRRDRGGYPLLYFKVMPADGGNSGERARTVRVNGNYSKSS